MAQRPPRVRVNIEYSKDSDDREKSIEIIDYIKKKHPDVRLKSQVGRRNSFEVLVNNELVHSRLSSTRYPDPTDLSNVLNEVKKGGRPRCCKHEIQEYCIIS